MKRVLLCLMALFLVVPHGVGAGFVPVLTNYSSLDYDGGLQNWSVTQDACGMMFFGNNSGMLSFDGYNWTTTPLPGRAVARSLMADGDRVYVGSYEEFGYFERDDHGRHLSLIHISEPTRH